MASTYSNIKIELIGTGEQSGTWGSTTNTNLGVALEEAIVGSANVTFSSGNVTLTLTDTNTSQAARNLRLNCTGTTGGARDLIVPAIQKVYLVNNGCADTITVKNATGTGIAVPAGKTMWVYNNGTNVLDAVTHLTSLTLASALPVTSGGTGSTSTTYCNLASNVTGTLPIANGGTGSTSASGARTNLGATTLGGNLFTITNPSAVTFPRFNADNTVSSLSASDFRTAIGAGTGTGTVTSVATSGSVNGLTLTGGPITSTGTVTLGGSITSVSTSGNFQMNSLGVGTAGSGTAGEIRATDNITAYYSSDRSLKENIQDVDNALNKVCAIGSKTFDWTDEYITSKGGEDGYFVQKSDFGVVAQDVQAVFPQAVRTRQDGTLAVDYEKLATLAFGAIKELVKRVEALESK
jgi:hypothetical protein